MYSPVSFFQKYDKEGKYIKKYCPELKNFPASCIYEPWKASEANQKSFGCIIGKDYPEPIVLHDEMRPVNMARMKENYANQDKSVTPKKASPKASPSKKEKLVA